MLRMLPSERAPVPLRPTLAPGIASGTIGEAMTDQRGETRS